MIKNNIYLDYGATSPISKSVKNRLESLSGAFSNPSAIYKTGLYNKKNIEEVRRLLAKEINANPDEIIFTSSGSESNALAIDGFLKQNKKYKYCYCSNIEHASILKNENCKPIVMVDSYGIIKLNMINKDGFYSIMMCNNEIGTLQPIKEVSKIIHDLGGVLHVDAVQCFGKQKIDVKDLGIDMMSISGHKIGSIRGVGALYVKRGIKISPIIYGTQENNLRGGTYNDLAIKTLGLAISDINYNEDTNVKGKRDYLLNNLLKHPEIKLNGHLLDRNSNNINIQVNDLYVNGAQLVTILDEDYGIQISHGSACHSYSEVPSYVLKAIGLSDKQAANSIRITLGRDTTLKDISYVLKVFDDIISKYRW